MNNFGLGLILSFTDNATSGIRNATGAFNELSQSVAAFSNADSAEAALLQISTAAGIVGNELYSVGLGITSLFNSVISTINNTGSTILSARSQLATLYGDAESGQRVLDQIKDYSAKSIFNFEDLIPSVIMLKANGIEAFDQIATSAYRASNGVEGVSQTLMDYAADLAAFNPQMHNVYGTGVQAAMGALNEYIAEGNAMSLKRGASLDILQLLGEEKGKTIEERSRQVADLIEQLGMVGMTANLAGTPMQRLANVEDVFFNLMTQISDSGVFEKYSSLIEKLTEYLFSIPDEELEQIAKIIAEALVEIMNPLEKVIDLGIKFVDWIRDLVKQNPELVKTIIKMTALSGVILVLTGAGLKLLSVLGRLKFSLSILFNGLNTANGIKIVGLLKNIAFYILPVIATVDLLKEAWDRDFLGMQETTKNFVRNTVDTFKLIFDAWGDNTLSEDNFERAKELGILPLIESILQLKYHFEFLTEGFKKGFDAFFDSLGKVLDKLGILNIETHGFRDFITKLLETITAPGLTDNWERLGYYLGKSTGYILLSIIIIPKLIKLLNTVLTIVGGIFKVASFIVKVLSVIGIAVTTILSIFGVVVTLPAWLVGAITVAIVALIALVYHFRDEIAETLVNIWENIKSLFSRLVNLLMSNPIISSIINAIARVVKTIINVLGTVIKSVIKFVANVINLIVRVVKAVAGVISTIIGIISKAVKFILEIIIPIAKGIGEILGAVFEVIWNILSRILNIIKSVVLGAWNIIKSVAELIKNVIYAIFQVVRFIIYVIIAIFETLWEGISTGLTFIANLFKEVFTWIYDNVIAPVVSLIASAFTWLADNIFEPVGEFISEVFSGIANVVKWIYEQVIKPVFTGIKNFIIAAVEKVDEVVTPILEAISDAIDAVAGVLSDIIESAGDFFGDVGDFFSNGANKLGSMIGLSTGGYVKTTGIAVLHPNEVVVNDKLTQGLGAFLADYAMAKEQSSPLVTQDIVAVDDDYKERDDDNPISPDPIIVKDDRRPDNSPVNEYIRNTTTENNTTENNSGDTTNDNRVTFESGSIVFNIDKDSEISNMSEEELNAMADKLMKIMARKIQLKQMQTRK